MQYSSRMLTSGVVTTLLLLVCDSQDYTPASAQSKDKDKDSYGDDSRVIESGGYIIFNWKEKDTYADNLATTVDKASEASAKETVSNSLMQNTHQSFIDSVGAEQSASTTFEAAVTSASSASRQPSSSVKQMADQAVKDAAARLKRAKEERERLDRERKQRAAEAERHRQEAEKARRELHLVTTTLSLAIRQQGPAQTIANLKHNGLNGLYNLRAAFVVIVNECRRLREPVPNEIIATIGLIDEARRELIAELEFRDRLRAINERVIAERSQLLTAVTDRIASNYIARGVTNKYGADASRGGNKSDCSRFVRHVLVESGFQVSEEFNTLSIQSDPMFRRLGGEERPRPGDIVVQGSVQRGGWHGHMGMFTRFAVSNNVVVPWAIQVGDHGVQDAPFGATGWFSTDNLGKIRTTMVFRLK